MRSLERQPGQLLLHNVQARIAASWIIFGKKLGGAPCFDPGDATSTVASSRMIAGALPFH